MKKISAYSISAVLLLSSLALSAQDTIPLVKKVRIGADIFGPAYYLVENNNLTVEGFISVDIDTNKAVVLEAGYQRYKYSQYNYDYLCNGVFLRTGVDFNLLSPEVAMGKYYAGIGLRYGLSIFTDEVPFLKQDNYWGTATSSVSPSTHTGHFIEASPGIRTELFKNFIVGWTIRLRILVYQSAGHNIKPINIPGYGNGTKGFSPGINYYIIWSIPYKR